MYHPTLETNTTHLGDCLQIMKEFPPQSIDMILADLPYGTTSCKWDTVIPFAPLWEQYERIIKPGGAIVLSASQPFTTALINSNIKHFRYCWVWDKVSVSNPQLAKKQPLKHHEDICVFSVKPHNYYPQNLERIEPKLKAAKTRSETELLGHIQRRADYVQEFTNYPKSIIRFPRPSKPVHPTQKPVPLFEYLIKTYSNEGDIILDNCAGAGTTGVAAVNTGRKYILIEKDKRYFDLIVERMKLNIS